MRVIIEERLIQVANKRSDIYYLLEDLLAECKELDQLTVTKLRPMSEAPMDETILAWNGVNFEIWYIDSKNPRTLYFEGWIPMPQYKPEEK